MLWLVAAAGIIFFKQQISLFKPMSWHPNDDNVEEDEHEDDIIEEDGDDVLILENADEHVIKRQLCEEEKIKLIIHGHASTVGQII